ncbi:hypothetical protein CkaCkLH20_08994 [Colletotrichum karsti]|uniref:Uncharacterized protein n=1 Tax=Colletotrichum karsti TaxID=1095194 RepID=A0A9P6I7P3_9PEZI|nr:uncharacterized protein CkaCkLH20_08994 [Colletotrichum karsti]KAF9873535.1 hypothetical protein CkaCkLH20_08994 [Colletotrichum karsti]
MPPANLYASADSFVALGEDRCQLICLVAKLYKFIDYDGKAYALAKAHLTASYGRAFDSIVDVHIKPPNSAWRQMGPRLRHALLADSRQFRNALRLRELELTEYAGVVVFFDKFKRLVRELMPEMRYRTSKHVRRTMMNEDDAYWRKRFKQLSNEHTTRTSPKPRTMATSRARRV